MQNDQRIADFRRRRDKALKAEKNDILRGEHGPKTVQALSAATKSNLSIESFDAGRVPPFSVDWNGKLQDAGGLVKAHVSGGKSGTCFFAWSAGVYMLMDIL